MIGKDLSSLLDLERCQDSILAQDFFGHTGPVAGEHHEDQLGWAKDVVCDLAVLAEGDTEAVAVTGLGLEAAVLDLDDTHSAYLRH